MAAKRYTARSIQEAIRLIKQEMGADAMILSTKRIPRNVQDPYGRDMFEVEAVPAGTRPPSPYEQAPPVRIEAPPARAEGSAITGREIRSALEGALSAGLERPAGGRAQGGHAGGRRVRPEPSERVPPAMRMAARGGASDERGPGVSGAGGAASPEAGRGDGAAYRGVAPYEPAGVAPPESEGVTPIGMEGGGRQGVRRGYGADADSPQAVRREGEGADQAALQGPRTASPDTREASPTSRALPEPPVPAAPDEPASAHFEVADGGRPPAARAAPTIPRTSRSRAMEEGIDGVFSERPAATSAEERPEAGLSAIQSELGSIREMLFLINQGEGIPALLQEHPEALGLYARLVRRGISERRAMGFLNAAMAEGKGPRTAEEITREVLRKILAAVDVTDPFALPEGGRPSRKIAAFVGPTGVGKTTTLAKLAAELSLKQKRKVGLISVDSYRIGALEQLKTYAAIMGLPCLPAFNREDLREALDRMRGREIILIDTAGHSHLDEKRMGELSELMAGEHAISSHLVLSITASRDNMRESVENFAALNPESYVFTKMDETRARGAVIEQVMDRRMPISYMTNGQRVPEDLVPAVKKDLLRFILN